MRLDQKLLKFSFYTNSSVTYNHMKIFIKQAVLQPLRKTAKNMNIYNKGAVRKYKKKRKSIERVRANRKKKRKSYNQNKEWTHYYKHLLSELRAPFRCAIITKTITTAAAIGRNKQIIQEEVDKAICSL